MLCLVFFYFYFYFFIALCVLFVPFSCVLLLGRVQIQIQWSRPTFIHSNTTKGLDQFLFAWLCFVCPFFYVCVWIHACMLRPCFLHSCHASLVLFPFVGLCLLVFGAFLFAWLYPLPFCGLFGCNQVQEYVLVMLACLSLAFLSFCLALHFRVSLVSLVCAL